MFDPNAPRSLDKAIVDSAVDAIVGTDLDGRVTRWNRAAETLFGYAAKEMISEPIAKLLRPDRCDQMITVLKQVSQGVRVPDQDAVFIGKHGTRVNVSLVVSPIRDDLGIVANFNLQQCAYMISESLVEPLRNLVASQEAPLNKDRRDRDQDERRRLSVDSVLPLLAATEDLLTYAQMYTVESAMSQVEIADVVRSALENLSEVIRSSGPQIVFNVEPRALVLGNKAALVLLFRLLIETALTGWKPAPVGIEITATPRFKDWLFTIRDSRVGIECQRNRVSDISDIGMPLTLCHRIVDWHGGTSRIESEADTGRLTFTFTLPAP